ncbi:hornerin-like [Iris pallida]|uniref:Hornerin-like n=1 Tax=Iris pallida TaxID=29817 RepID=A0AAX6FQL9_IRIPA|nr:hornerin-like [Iris pallida]KAJ6829577.1 hornerin-like [Iris pallida]
MRRPLQSVPGLAGDTRVARAANPIAFGKRPVEYVPSRPFRLVREREGTRTRATRCPRVTALRRLVWTGWALGARVCRARGCGGRGGARGDPPPAPDPNGLLYAALDDTTAGPANVPRPASGRAEPASTRTCYLVDPASSHMLVSKIKPCMCKYEQVQTVKLRMAH